MKQDILMTKEGLEKVSNELNQLIRVDREVIKKAISEARELGDLKENAEYHAAKEKQSHIEGRVLLLQAQVNGAKVIDVSSIKSDKVVFGATVTLINTETEKSSTYKLVGDMETDSRAGKISYQSPVGKSLIGKEEGDVVTVRAPKGDLEYEIEEILYE